MNRLISFQGHHVWKVVEMGGRSAMPEDRQIIYLTSKRVKNKPERCSLDRVSLGSGKNMEAF